MAKEVEGKSKKAKKVRKKSSDLRSLIFGLIFTIIGVILVWYALNLPCNIAPLSQGVEGFSQEVDIEFPKEIQRLICLSTDFSALISMLIGTLSIIVGIPGIFRGLTGQQKH